MCTIIAIIATVIGANIGAVTMAILSAGKIRENSLMTDEGLRERQSIAPRQKGAVIETAAPPATSRRLSRL